MKNFILNILTFLVVFSSCSSPTNKDSNNPEKDNSKDLQDSITYPDCFSEIDTANLKQGLGCGSIFVYKETEKGIITVSIDPDKIELSTYCKEFELTEGIEINLEIYPTEIVPKDSIRTIDFCECINFTNAQKRIPLKAEFGKITTVILPSKNSVLNAERITVRLNDLKFTSPFTGKLIEFEEVIIWNASVGWFAG